jgi:signal peptide peptidase SppA
MKHYDRILRAVCATPWAMMPEKLEAMMCFLALKAEGRGPSDETLGQIEANAALIEARRSSAKTASGGSVAVLPLYGVISHRMNLMNSISGAGGTSTAMFGAEFQEAVNDPGVKAIVIDIDSPGGSVEGVDELASQIYAARGKKPITAVSNCLCASAAYYIGSQADEIVASPTSLTGSIGVYSAHQDISRALENEGVAISLISAGKYKVEGNPYAPLTDDARQAMQSMVDDFYDMFVKAVARGRKTKMDDVRNGFGQGRVVGAKDAVKLGMADRVGTLADVLNSFGAQAPSSTSARADAEIAAPAAESEATEVKGDEEAAAEAAIAAEQVALQLQSMDLALA